jgi:SOS response regulatory protein OraA/RecX
MKIESLKTTPDRAGRYWLRLEDGTSMALYRQTVEDFGLYAGMELSPDDLSRLKTAAGEMSAKMRAVRIVSASAVSKRDLEHRLVQKGETPADAQAAVEWMEGLDLLDDRKTAEQIVQSCIRKGYGIARAKQALFEKKIPKSLWDEVLLEYPEQTEKLVAFLRMRLGDSWDEKDVKRAVDAAMRRGHSYAAIRRALNIVTAGEDDFPEEW